MTPVLQTAVTGLVWAISVSLVILAATFCTTWVLRVTDDKKAVEVEEKLREVEEQRKRISYICDFSADCNSSETCHANGGDCTRTTYVEHAANFHKLDMPYGAQAYYTENDRQEKPND